MVTVKGDVEDSFPALPVLVHVHVDQLHPAVTQVLMQSPEILVLQLIHVRIMQQEEDVRVLLNGSG